MNSIEEEESSSLGPVKKKVKRIPIDVGDDGDNGSNGLLDNDDNEAGTIEGSFSFLPDMDTDDVFENFPFSSKTLQNSSLPSSREHL